MNYFGYVLMVVATSSNFLNLSWQQAVLCSVAVLAGALLVIVDRVYSEKED